MGVHGLLDEERTRSQPFEVDLDAELDLSAAGRTDSIAGTVDYAVLAGIIDEVLGGPHADLIEHLAEQIASRVLTSERVDAVEVTVRKLRPPVPLHMASAGVSIRRERARFAGNDPG